MAWGNLRVGYYSLTCKQWNSYRIRYIYPVESTNLFVASSFTSLCFGYLNPCIIKRTASTDRVLKTYIWIFLICSHDLSRLNSGPAAWIEWHGGAIHYDWARVLFPMAVMMRDRHNTRH